MRFKFLFVPVLFVAACMSLPIPGLSGKTQTQSQQTETSSSSTTEEMHVNGRPVSVATREDDEADEAPRASKKKKHKQRGDDDEADFGQTCHKNHECDADACFVGKGDLGYCTKFCNSWSDCPSHWECKKPGNAPQRICMQDAD
jgi:hypothetical protein